MKANRIVYGDTLIELAASRKELLVLDADVAKSIGTAQFAAAYPDRFINVGIAEQNMMGIAAGLATCGKLPFAATFSVFTSMRAVEQIRNAICYPSLNVKIAGTHGGLETGEDGATHQAVEDVAIIRSIPKIRLFIPSTPVATRYLTRLAAEVTGPVYLRFGRAPSPEFYDEDEIFPEGGSKVLREGEDIAILAYGNMVSVAVQAADRLAEQGISARVLDMYSIKPFDTEAVLKAASEVKGIITIEDHSIIGGLGGAVCETLSGGHQVPVIRLGLNDEFGRSGKGDELHVLYGLTPERVIETARSIMAGDR